jgi:hypothetical protein
LVSTKEASAVTTIYNDRGQIEGEVRENTIYNDLGQIEGEVRGGTIYNDRGQIEGEVSGDGKTIGAAARLLLLKD